MLKNKNRGQGTLEYAVIIAVVVGALIAMQIYMKRGIEGKAREATEQIGEQFDAGTTYVHSRTDNRTSKTVQTLKDGQTISAMGIGGGTKEERTLSGDENVAKW
jgi:uncharacterized protein (UPF0333 family)